MKNKKWEVIHELYTRMERLYGKSLYQSEETLYGSGAEHQDQSAAQGEVSAREYSLDDMIEFRAELRNQLDYLKATFLEEHPERDTYMILFAIVAHIDEIVQNKILRAMNVSWPLLQKELFQIENAGEVYYEVLDGILQKPQTDPFIYEVYYFCLRYGFRGRYENKPASVVEYIKKLKDKLQLEEGRTLQLDKEATGHIKKIRSPHWYYVIGAGIVAATYIILVIVAKLM